jgi:predicted nuclease of predicted toxin-antitoxin system
MPWLPLANPSSDDIGPEFKKKTRFLIDENLGIEVARYLKDIGFSAIFAGDVGLNGHSDEDVFSYAWREGRMLLTHDRDFLDDACFPEHRNPGVVVLPGGDGNQQAIGIGIGTAVKVFSSAPSIWEKTKSVISPTGEMTIRRRNYETGRIETTRYRMTGRDYAEVWED